MDYKLLRQHNAITTARYEMTATEKNIVYILLAQLEDDDPADRIYKIQVRELEQRIGRELKYNQLKDATKKLITRVYNIASRDELLQVGLLTAARYKKGTGTIELELSRNVRPYLFQLKQCFTTFQLHMALSLKSKFSKRMYEMLSQYKNTGIMKITVETLKCRLGLIDLETGEEQYRNFNDFEKKVLLIAQQELQEPMDISFTYTKKKQGRKFTDLAFQISYTATRQFDEQSVESSSVERIKSRLTSKFGLSQWQAQLIVQIVPAEQIAKTLYDISIRVADRKVKNIGGFTAKTFDNKYNLGLFRKIK